MDFIPDPTLAKTTQTGFMPDPNQSAMALGHSNSLITKSIGSAGQSVLPGSSVGSNLMALPGALKGAATAAGESGLQFIQSAVHAPVDIASELTGGKVDTSVLPNLEGTGQQTYQGEFASKTVPAVNAGQQTPLQATLGTVGKVLAGASNFLGFGKAGTIAADTAPAVIEKGTQVAQKGIDIVRSPVNVATKRLASTAETMTKAERELAIKEGRMTPKGQFLPSATESRAGEIMKGKTYSNPVKTVKAVQDEISTRGQEAEQYLETNNKPISNKEDFEAFQNKKQQSEIFMTKSEAAAYDEQVGVFQQVLKKYGGYNTANYYKALKEYETRVTANLPKGKDALLQPGGAARVQAAKDVRSVVRDMIGTKNPEFKGKMFDLASLYDSLDNVVATAEKGGHSLAKRYPKTATAIGTAGTFLGVEEARKQLGL